MKSKELVRQWCLKNDFDFSKLEQYANYLLLKNKEFNLVGFDEEKLWLEGIYSSILCLQKINEISNFIVNDKEILDIGAGSGLPSIPFLLLFPNIKLTIFEPLHKRFNFLQEIKEKFNLVNLKIECIRVEDSTLINYFDLITARAVSELKNIILASYHLLKKNGEFVLIKGKKNKMEIENAIKILDEIKPNFRVFEVVDYEKFNINENYIVTLKKQIETPKHWPLSWSKIIKK